MWKIPGNHLADVGDHSEDIWKSVFKHVGVVLQTLWNHVEDIWESLGGHLGNIWRASGFIPTDMPPDYRGAVRVSRRGAAQHWYVIGYMTHSISR